MHYWSHQYNGTITHLFDELDERVVEFGLGFSLRECRLTESFIAEIVAAGFSPDEVKVHFGEYVIFTYNEMLAMWIKLKYV